MKPAPAVGARAGLGVAWTRDAVPVLARGVRRARAIALVLALAASLGTATAALAANPPTTPSEKLLALADRYASLRVAYDPTIAYVTGLKAPDHARFADRTAAGIRQLERDEDSFQMVLDRIPTEGLTPAARATRAVLKEMLESSKQLRTCKAELWDLSHFTGWQVTFPLVADAQPVDSAALRAQALKRWSSLPAYIKVQIANLRTGLRQGYSVPQPVVNRVLQQIDGLVAAAPTDSPFYAPAAHSDDAAFKQKFETLLGEQIKPAIRDFRVFLATEYLPKARETLALSALPNGAACYQAQLRSYTTLNRTPAEVMALGEKTVAENQKTVVEIGSKLFGTADVAEVIKRTNDAPAEHFKSPDELLASVRDLLGIAIEKTRPYFVKLPDQRLVIEPVPDYQVGSGVSAHYDMQPDVTKPGKYIEPTEEWQSRTHAQAEITLVHEAIPGHHLQIALARELSKSSNLSKLADNSAYIEGWARYAERLSEEAGIYRSDYTRIARRIWPARGMVVDPGIHAFGWSREKAVAYLVATGRFDERGAEATVDRIATIPGQLTSYDTGGLEIVALRSEAEAALGKRFDVKQFHQRVLEQGVVPLQELRDHVNAWVNTQRR